MIAGVVLLVLVGAVVVARFVLWRNRGQVMAGIDQAQSVPVDLAELSAADLTRQHTYFVTVRDTYFDKPRKIRRDPERAAWVQARITQIQEQYARGVDETPPTHAE